MANIPNKLSFGPENGPNKRREMDVKTKDRPLGASLSMLPIIQPINKLCYRPGKLSVYKSRECLQLPK